MGGIIKKGGGNKPSRPTATPQAPNIGAGSMFKGFTEETVSRKGQVKSISLSLSEIEEFEHNVRKLWDEEELTALADSIETNGITEEIGVFHIKNGERYIIADGHRRKKAIEMVYGPDYRIEVIVRKDFPDYTKEVELELIKTGMFTSSLKTKLTNYEEMESIEKYINYLDELHPEKAPHLLTQKSVYTDFGFTKAKAMKVGKIMSGIDPSQRVRFQNKDISLRMLDAIAKIFPEGGEELQNTILTAVESGKVESVADLKSMLDIHKEVESSIPGDMENREETIQAISEEKFNKDKEEREDLKPKTAETEEMRYVKAVKSSVKAIEKAFIRVDFNTLSEGNQIEVKGSFIRLQNLLEQAGITLTAPEHEEE